MMKLANYARQFDAHVFRFPCLLIGDNRCRAHQFLCFQDQGKRWLEIRVTDPAHERLEDRVEDEWEVQQYFHRLPLCVYYR